jgi:hypothetical protein
MIELEVYAAGVRNLDKVLGLDHEFEAVPGLRYKIDSNHDIVYMEMDQATLNLEELKALFKKLELDVKFVGAIPPELAPKKRTQRLRVG